MSSYGCKGEHPLPNKFKEGKKKNLFEASFNYTMLLKMMKRMAEREGKIFSVKTLTKNTDLDGRVINHYMHHLVECGALEEVRWAIKPNGGRRKVVYQQNFLDTDIGGYLLRMRLADEERWNNEM